MLSTMESSFAMLFGKYDFGDLKRANFLLTMVFYVPFYIATGLILTNIFVAVSVSVMNQV